MDVAWSRADTLAAWALGVAAVGAVGTWLAVPGFREWGNSLLQSPDPITLGDLAAVKAYEPSMPSGLVKATEQTLREINEALPEASMVWVHEKDFGGSFRWGSVEFLEKFSWVPEVAAREFLDPELEALRLDLTSSVKDFLYSLAANTDDVFPATDSDIRKIPAQYDEHDNYSDKLFHQKAREMNEAAEDVWNAYQTLFRRARSKLAHSTADEEEPW